VLSFSIAPLASTEKLAEIDTLPSRPTAIADSAIVHGLRVLPLQKAAPIPEPTGSFARR